MITTTRFRGLLHNWARDHGDDFQYYWPLKGGWEIWAQVDVMAYLLRKDNLMDVLREQHIYTSERMSVDILLNTNAVQDGDKIPVEFKAQSFNNINNFLSAMTKDKEKIETQRNGDYKKSACLLIGFCIVDADIERLRQETNKKREPIFGTVYQTGEFTILAAEMGRDGQWKPALRVQQQ